MIYLDASPVLSILLNENRPLVLRRNLPAEGLFSSLLLEAEIFSVLNRENIPSHAFDEIKAAITWVTPPRSLEKEITEALSYGHLRGGDLLHVATAMYAFKTRKTVGFYSVDTGQRKIAGACGFKLIPERL